VGEPKPPPNRQPLSAAEAKRVLENPQIIIDQALTSGPTKIPQHTLRDASDAVFQATGQIVVAHIKRTKLADHAEICELIRKTFLALADPIR
jgi:hypothetical protein